MCIRDSGSDETGYSNIGISGPVTHAFVPDIKHLSLQDTYAAFAGWQTVHQEIFNVPIERAERIMSTETQKLSRYLDEQDYQQTTPVALTAFFGEYALVAEVRENDSPGIAIVDENGADWFGIGSPDQPIDWQLALDIWRGRKLLANFNPVKEF